MSKLKLIGFLFLWCFSLWVNAEPASRHYTEYQYRAYSERYTPWYSRRMPQQRYRRSRVYLGPNLINQDERERPRAYDRWSEQSPAYEDDIIDESENDYAIPDRIDYSERENNRIRNGRAHRDYDSVYDDTEDAKADNSSDNSVLPEMENNGDIPKLTALQVLRLSSKQCHRILKSNNVTFKVPSIKSTITMPILLTSRVNHVRFIQNGNKANLSVMDCRLAVSLLMWTRVLKPYGIKQVRYQRSYTRNATVKDTGLASGHRWALAIDVLGFKTQRYGWLNVKRDWGDRRKNISPCGSVQNREHGVQKILRSLVCQSAEQQHFSVMLTPHYNRAHHDHLHLELRTTQVSLVLR